MRRHLPFLLILLGYFIVAGLYAGRVPDWQAPDEPAHYNVVRQIAAIGCCPQIQPGDWDQVTLDQLKSTNFSPFIYDLDGDTDFAAIISVIQYEDHQPPLYYLLLAPVYQLTGGSLIALRLASVVIGAGVVIAANAVALRAFHGRYSVAWAAAAFVAFLPQHVHILASVNNDALAWALVGVILWASLDHTDGGKTPAWLLGLLVGAALLTKTTAYMMAGVALIAVLARPLTPRPQGAKGSKMPADTETPSMSSLSDLGSEPLAHAESPPRPASEGEGDLGGEGMYPKIRSLILYLIPALLLGLLWWARNIGVYGFPDFLGLREHDAVVVGQLRTANLIAEAGFTTYLSTALRTTVTSFFGQFGWMKLPLFEWTVFGYLALIIVGLVGVVVSPLRRIAARGTWLLFGMTALLAIAMLVYYNTSFVQFQGRYVYPLLIPLAVTVALGLDGLRERIPVARRFPWLTAAALSLIALLDVWLLWRVLVPNLTP